MKIQSVRFILVLTALIFISDLFGNTGDAVQDLYFNAKTRTMEQNWDQAIQLYSEIIKQYPDSRYFDESRFWIGYCYEKKEGGLEKAFTAFNELVSANKSSSWADDALMHQIYISEKLFHSENPEYRNFLIGKLSDPQINVRNQAALALARNGHKSALPVLKDIPKDEDSFEEAQILIREIEKNAGQESGVAATVRDELVIDQEAPNPSVSLKADGHRIGYFAKQRFAQYQNLTKTEDVWSQEELIDFGLWHILRADIFDYYIMLDSAGKEKFMRKLWLTNDPTPTTTLNEAQQEFYRRIKYARDHYSYFDNLPGHYYAPWDARGEVYIKYGTPHSIKIRGMEELWYYPEHNHLQFMVRRYVTNIFGRAIFTRYGTRWGMWADPQKIDPESFELIYKPVFVYKFEGPFKELEDLETTVKMDGGYPTLHYSIPAKSFKIQKDDSGYYIDYTERYAIYNSEYLQVKTEETPKRLTGTKSELKNMTIEQDVKMELGPGDYFMGIRLEDKAAKKRAVSKMNFKVKNF